MLKFIDFDLFYGLDKPHDDINRYVWIGGEEVPIYAEKLPALLHDMTDKVDKVVMFREEEQNFGPCEVLTISNVNDFFPAVTCVAKVIGYDLAEVIEKTNENLKRRYMVRLSKIDELSIRAIRAIASNTQTQEDIERLTELETEALEIREKLSRL